MRRSAFTILEILAVVAIVVAISAVVLPPLAARAVQTRMTHAARAIEAGATLTRARATQEGGMLALVAERWEEEWVLFAERRSADPAQPGEQEDPMEPSARRVEVGSFADVRVSTILPEPESLDEGIELGGLDGEFPAALGEDPLLSPGAEERQRVVLATFFSDGSCRSDGPVYLIGETGDRRVLRFGPVSGRVEWRDLPRENEEIAQRDGAADRVRGPAPPTSEEREP